MTLTMYLNQYWKDERLEFSTSDEELTLASDFSRRIWVPDIFFPNDKYRYSVPTSSLFPCVFQFYLSLFLAFIFHILDFFFFF